MDENKKKRGISTIPSVPLSCSKSCRARSLSLLHLIAPNRRVICLLWRPSFGSQHNDGNRAWLW